jgi:hypothetical protein
MPDEIHSGPADSIRLKLLEHRTRCAGSHQGNAAAIPWTTTDRIQQCPMILTVGTALDEYTALDTESSPKTF